MAVLLTHTKNRILSNIVKRVLILTYYWPPIGGAGVQRWLKHSKYLREFGWEPVIYTASNPDRSIVDESLVAEIPEDIEVVFNRVFEPYDIYRALTGAKKSEAVSHGFTDATGKSGIVNRLGMWVRANFFIPDARKFWIKPSIKVITKYLKTSPVDVIISTGPPHSMHLIAMELNKKTGIPWVADFRDPWTNNDFYDKLPLTKWADQRHKSYELEVLQKASRVVTVSWNWANQISEMSGRKVDVVTNGFDPSDFKTKSSGSNKKFVILHAGSMYSDRNPRVFWNALGEMVTNNDGFKNDLEIKLTGTIDGSVIRSIHEAGLKDNTELISYQPHNIVIESMQNASVLLLLLNDSSDILGRIPGKLFEYLAAGRFIMCIGNTDGDSAKIISETQSGTSRMFDDYQGISEDLEKAYNQWQKGSLDQQAHSIDNYTRKSCTQKYSEIFNSLQKG